MLFNPIRTAQKINIDRGQQTSQTSSQSVQYFSISKNPNPPKDKNKDDCVTYVNM